MHVGDAYRGRRIRFGKSLYNLGLDESVHDGIREEQESQYADEHYCSYGKARIRRYLQRRQLSSVGWWMFILHMLYHLVFFITIALCAFFILKA
jgi:hypothetical protein